ncbi:hypothetical protein MSAN_00928500 [Mycena sanguinolenta]|uniref:Uncharacterized protein n=1 Tax=Mycena sanguinolenta TaxID=230812 RepID=A0A8H6YWW1_9AGAR|nr:hypothetical protein MSAN_00928500 [Mycena sanguinolenta]
MADKYMQNIVRQEKNFEFRRYRISDSVQRIWFYLNAPFSHVAYICEIDPARTRNSGDPPLPEDGIGNAEFNTERGGEWERYDYAYRIRSVWRIKEPIGLKTMKEKYGVKGAPRALVYVPELMASEVVWDQQECVWGRTDGDSGPLAHTDILQVPATDPPASKTPPSTSATVSTAPQTVPLAPTGLAVSTGDGRTAHDTRGTKRKDRPQSSDPGRRNKTQHV